jgi:protein SCO1/2
VNDRRMPSGGSLNRWRRVALFALMLLTACKKNDEPFEFLQPTPQPSVLPRHWQVPDFALVERTGRAVTLNDLRGKIWVADFFYASCPGPCPIMTSRLSEVHQRTRHWADVSLVSISTDPANDTPAVLQQYAQRYGADDRWLFLTGEKRVLYDLANKGFKLSVTDEGGTPAEPITHSTKLVLIDRNGTIRGFYEGTLPAETQRLVGDIERLRKESR